MTTADWALVISLCSFVVSAAGFIWNVWSKFIYPKAKVRVTFSSNILMQQGEPNHNMLLLQATNYGPGDVTRHMVIGRSRTKRLGKFQHMILNPLHNFPAQKDYTLGPFSGGLPKKIQVGEDFAAYFVILHEGLRDENIVDVGFVDTFGRNHWAPRKSVAKVRIAVKKAFEAHA
ncbi:hypothetical protein JZX87_03450 [Agrobacterium sp. Ap1]|uniref:hypothetical protein n=1 Tax=Agrobacterium sp. Ap1 TaxID=2815337 RepID=UPI001A8CA1B6|nr:hypothetical protein [Agrobacterium sp. Ap1]MBO0140222.1 hypothetical protein [Agrobacterium sp. Ap1]